MAQVGKAGVAIRGGVPICWPQFGGFENAAGAPGMKHGFARTSGAWKLARQTEDSATFLLTSDKVSSSDVNKNVAESSVCLASFQAPLVRAKPCFMPGAPAAFSNPPNCGQQMGTPPLIATPALPTCAM